MPHRFQNALAPLLVVALAGATVSGRQSEESALQSMARSARPAHHSVVEVEGAPPVALTIISDRPDAVVARLSATAASAIHLLVEWFGPLNQPSITVVDLPWRLAAPGASYAGVVATRVRWITPERDVVAERALIAGVARQFWLGGHTAAEASFREGLAMFTATRGIHEVLAGRNFAAPRFLGGFVSMPLRSLQLSPNLAGPRPLLDEFDEVLRPAQAEWRFSSAADGTPARRAAMSLQTLERTIGWPATQQALAEVRARAASGPITPELLAAVLGEQRGVSMDWYVRDLVRGAGSIDYAVGAIENDMTSRDVTTVTIERLGSGSYAGTDQPRSAGPARSIEVLARFADASETRAFIDGRDAQSRIALTSHSPVALVTVDPDERLLMDDNRSNNGRLIGAAPIDRTGLRLVMNWVIWLQNVMLTYAAIA